MDSVVNTPRLVTSFMEMVGVASPSGQESKFAKYLLNLGHRLKLTCHSDRFGNIYLYWPGQGEPLMLNTHLDTVSPGENIRPKVCGRYIVSDGTTILGADSKAGIAAMFEMITAVQSSNISHRPILITLSCNEESGIPTADKIVSDIRTCVVPDRGTPIGEVITAAPFAQVFEVKISGKAAYAQTDYDKGHHAIMAAVHLIANLPWGNIDPETTTNVGIVQGGLMTSQIPDFCSFKGSCYSFNQNSFSSFLKRLKDIANQTDTDFGTHSRVKMLEYFSGYSISQNDPLVEEVVRAIQLAGLQPVRKIYKAVTNANLLNQIGIKTVLMSTGVQNQHTVHERMAALDLTKLTKIMINLSAHFV